jgi:hypothetical protein
MSLINSVKSFLSKAEVQSLVAPTDASISFVKPTNARSECWTNFSQICHGNILQDYITCLQSKTILKWTSNNRTRVKNLSHKHIQIHKNKTRYFSGTSIFNIVPVPAFPFPRSRSRVPVPAFPFPRSRSGIVHGNSRSRSRGKRDGKKKGKNGSRRTLDVSRAAEPPPPIFLKKIQSPPLITEKF